MICMTKTVFTYIKHFYKDRIVKDGNELERFQVYVYFLLHS